MFEVDLFSKIAICKQGELICIIVNPCLKNFLFQIVDEWLELLRDRHREDPGRTVAVHCVAGLGRAPVLVAIALIELGMRYEDAVELIRM